MGTGPDLLRSIQCTTSAEFLELKTKDLQASRNHGGVSVRTQRVRPDTRGFSPEVGDRGSSRSAYLLHTSHIWGIVMRSFLRQRGLQG